MAAWWVLFSRFSAFEPPALRKTFFPDRLKLLASSGK
jgi:hypothetical protein